VKGCGSDLLYLTVRAQFLPLHLILQCWKYVEITVGEVWTVGQAFYRCPTKVRKHRHYHCTKRGLAFSWSEKYYFLNCVPRSCFLYFWIAFTIHSFLMMHPVLKNHTLHVKKQHLHHLSWQRCRAHFLWWKWALMFPNILLLFWLWVILSDPRFKKWLQIIRN